jgi:hypothetical protein
MEEQSARTGHKRLSTKDMAGAADANETRVEEGDGRDKSDERLAAGEIANGGNGEELTPLLSAHETGDFRSRWSSIQTGFVDEPRKTVEQADELVAEIMQRLAQSFSDQRSSLERQWEHSDKVSTEELRLALRRYRSFCERLLSI